MQDPRRPMFVPAPVRPVQGAVAVAPSQPQITGFRYELSADGQYALVEFAARDAQAFAPIVNANRADVKVFRRNAADMAEVEREFQKLKPGFSAGKLTEGGLR